MVIILPKNISNWLANIFNVPKWNDWSKVIYSQVLKMFLFQSYNWVSAQDSKSSNSFYKII